MDPNVPSHRGNPPKLPSLKPLQTIFTEPDTLEPSYRTPITPSTSYIAGRSAPTTPGILSQSNSAHRLKSSHRSATRLAMKDLDGQRSLPKSKSTSMLALREQRRAPSTAAPKTPSRTTKPAVAARDDGEWFFRAGLAIAGEARDNKGQSWLASRASTTNLAVALNDYDVEEGAEYDGSAADDMITSPYTSQRNLRPSNSRLHSARPSRRGSRTGSRSELSYFTPLSTRTPINHDAFDDHDADYFGGGIALPDGPDFVDDEFQDEFEDDDTHAEEAEIADLTKETGFGFGRLLDRVVGWSLFDVRDDATESEEDVGIINSTVARSDIEKLVEKAREQPVLEEVDVLDDDEGGWDDMAWLLSVASKVLL